MVEISWAWMQKSVNSTSVHVEQLNALDAREWRHERAGHGARSERTSVREPRDQHTCAASMLEIDSKLCSAAVVVGSGAAHADAASVKRTAIREHMVEGIVVEGWVEQCSKGVRRTLQSTKRRWRDQRAMSEY